MRPQGRAIERRYKISAKDARIITVVAVDCCVKRPSPPPAELPERYRTDYDDEQRPATAGQESRGIARVD